MFCIIIEPEASAGSLLICNSLIEPFILTANLKKPLPALTPTGVDIKAALAETREPSFKLYFTIILLPPTVNLSASSSIVPALAYILKVFIPVWLKLLAVI